MVSFGVKSVSCWASWDVQRAGPGRSVHEAGHQPGSGQEVVLLIDEGVHFFDLRALYIRGQVKPAEEPREASVADCTWVEVAPLKTVAWDYGMMREVRDER
jgi:hypothetical protein